jgi:hypothetical protein
VKTTAASGDEPEHRGDEEEANDREQLGLVV